MLPLQIQLPNEPSRSNAGSARGYLGYQRSSGAKLRPSGLLPQATLCSSCDLNASSHQIQSHKFTLSIKGQTVHTYKDEGGREGYGLTSILH